MSDKAQSIPFRVLAATGWATRYGCFSCFGGVLSELASSGHTLQVTVRSELLWPVSGSLGRWSEQMVIQLGMKKPKVATKSAAISVMQKMLDITCDWSDLFLRFASCAGDTCRRVQLPSFGLRRGDRLVLFQPSAWKSHGDMMEMIDQQLRVWEAPICFWDVAGFMNRYSLTGPLCSSFEFTSWDFWRICDRYFCISKNAARDMIYYNFNFRRLRLCQVKVPRDFWPLTAGLGLER